MKQRNITVTIVPDKRRIKDDVTYPLKLRITIKGIENIMQQVIMQI